MEQFIAIIVAFFSGGGIMMVANYRINRKTAKLDYDDKMYNFMKCHNLDLMKRITDLELKVDQMSNELKNWRCDRPDCPTRLR